MTLLHKSNINDELGNPFTSANTLPVTAYDTAGAAITPAKEATLEALINLTGLLFEIIKNPMWLSQPNNALQVLTMANSVITTVTTCATVTTVGTVTNQTNIGGLSAAAMITDTSSNAWVLGTGSLYT